MDEKVLARAREVLNKIVEASHVTDDIQSNFTTSAGKKMFGGIQGVKIAHGASRFVLIPENEPFVFKIDLNVREVFDDNDKLIVKDTLSYQNYYCNHEADIYEMAENEQLGYYFAEITYLDTIFGKDFYVQEKAVPFKIAQHGITKIEDKEEAETSQLYEYCIADDIPFEWLYDFVSWNGYEEGVRLLDFLCDNDIDDLHDGNLGYINDRPVLYDFCGFEG